LHIDLSLEPDIASRADCHGAEFYGLDGPFHMFIKDRKHLPVISNPGRPALKEPGAPDDHSTIKATAAAGILSSWE
jgi:hypothetical protein